jgi:hypothetical protein
VLSSSALSESDEALRAIKAARARKRHLKVILAALVRAAAKFENGVLVERPDESEAVTRTPHGTLIHWP